MSLRDFQNDNFQQKRTLSIGKLRDIDHSPFHYKDTRLFSLTQWYNSAHYPPMTTALYADTPFQLDKIVGMAMLIVATTVFLYYTVWTLLMVGTLRISDIVSSPGRNSPSSTMIIHSKDSSCPESGRSEYLLSLRCSRLRWWDRSWRW